MTSLRIGASLWMAGLRGALEYRVDFVLMTLMGLVRQGTGMALMWVILARFETIAGWTLGEVIFLYGMRLPEFQRGYVWSRRQVRDLVRYLQSSGSAMAPLSILSRTVETFTVVSP